MIYKIGSGSYLKEAFPENPHKEWQVIQELVQTVSLEILLNIKDHLEFLVSIGGKETAMKEKAEFKEGLEHIAPLLAKPFGALAPAEFQKVFDFCSNHSYGLAGASKQTTQLFKSFQAISLFQKLSKIDPKVIAQLKQLLSTNPEERRAVDLDALIMLISEI